MEYTKESIAKPLAMINGAAGVTPVANDFKRTPSFSYLKCKFFELGSWEVTKEVRDFIASNVLDEETEEFCFNSRWGEGEDANTLSVAYNAHYLGPIAQEVSSAIKRAELEYRLKSEFTNVIKLTDGTQVRLAKNSPVKNTYAVRSKTHENVFLLGVFRGDGSPRVASDITIITSYDTMKKMFMSFDYEHIRNLELCNRDVKTLAERGSLDKDYAVGKRWFLNSDEIEAIVDNAIENISEQSFSIVTRGSDSYQSFSVCLDSEVDELDVVASGLPYDRAESIVELMKSVRDYNASIIVHGNRIVRANEEIQNTIKSIERMEDDVVSWRAKLIEMNAELSAVLRNNNIKYSVIKESQSKES